MKIILIFLFILCMAAAIGALIAGCIKFKEYRAEWEPLDPFIKNGNLIYSVTKYNQSYLVVDRIPMDLPLDERLERMSQAESDCMLKCSTLNNSTKLLRRR